MYRLAYFFYRLGTSVAAWVRRRFTVAGYAALAGMIIAGMAGFDTEKSLTHQVFALLFLLLIVSLLSSLQFGLRCSVERILPRFGSVGQPMPYRLAVRNRSSRFQKGLVVAENLADGRMNLAEFTAYVKAQDKRSGSFRLAKTGGRRLSRRVAHTVTRDLPTLPPDGAAEIDMELRPERRGIVRFESVGIGCRDPLGLCRATQRRPLPGTVLILPRRYYLPPIALPGSQKYQQGGVALASSIGESEEFVSLRDYRAGDPLRRIHWKSWAKAGEPIVKEYEDEFFVRHALILDTFLEEPGSAAFEEAVSVAASFACTIATQESLLDLLFVGAQAYCFTVGRGLAHTEQMLEILAAVQVCLGKPFKDLSNLVLNHAGIVSGCILVLLAWDEPRQELVRRLRFLKIPLLVFVVVEKGQSKAVPPGVMGDDASAFHVMEVGEVEKALAGL